MPLAPELRAACESRRAALAARLGDRPALFPAGTRRPRNYAGNSYAFRAGSHFLYLIGAGRPDEMAVWDGAGWAVYAPAPGPDDHLWSGQQPSLSERSEDLGCPVRPMVELAGALPPGTATLPAVDVATCLEQTTLLGRDVRPGVLAPADAFLADAMIELRLRHDDAAITEIRRAVSATAAAHRAGMRASRPGTRESEVHAAMEREITARGLSMAYGPIVTVHGEILHNEDHGGLLGPDDMLLADVGAESAAGWASDVTRTWPTRGRFSSVQRDVYSVVLSAQERTIDAARPGARYRDIHLLAARLLAEGLVALGVLRGDPAELAADGLAALFFPHGIGHLLGLDVHDMEDLGDRAGYAPGRRRDTAFGLRALRLDRELVPGMVVTIEPGLYFAPTILQDPALTAGARDRVDWRRVEQLSGIRGIRIEDDVLITAASPDVLTAEVEKTPDAIEEAMSSGGA